MCERYTCDNLCIAITTRISHKIIGYKIDVNQANFRFHAFGMNTFATAHDGRI